MKMFEDVFLNQIFPIDYDKFTLEITVQKMQKEHYAKCNFRDKGDYKEAHRSIFRFFNEVVWFYDIPIRNVNGGYSVGSHVGLNYSVNCESYILPFKQKVHNEKQHLALGFYREALSNESPYYRFICFDKILQIPFTGKGKGSWMKLQMLNLTDKLAITFRDRKLKEISNKPLDEWLYEDGRHGLVHATVSEERFIRDPNNFDDWEQIKWANCVMEDLAKKIIVNELNVPSP